MSVGMPASVVEHAGALAYIAVGAITNKANIIMINIFFIYLFS